MWGPNTQFTVLEGPRDLLKLNCREREENREGDKTTNIILCILVNMQLGNIIINYY